MDRDIIGRWTNVERLSYTLDISYQINSDSIRYKKTSTGKKAAIGHPFPHKLNTWIQINTSGTPIQSDFRIWIIYQCTIRVSIQTNPEVIRMNHIALTIRLGAYPSYKFYSTYLELNEIEISS